MKSFSTNQLLDKMINDLRNQCFDMIQKSNYIDVVSNYKVADDMYPVLHEIEISTDELEYKIEKYIALSMMSKKNKLYVNVLAIMNQSNIDDLTN